MRLQRPQLFVYLLASWLLITLCAIFVAGLSTAIGVAGVNFWLTLFLALIPGLAVLLCGEWFLFKRYGQ